MQAVSFKDRKKGEIEVTVHQTVKDVMQKLLHDGTIKPIYTSENHPIERMEIEKE